MNLEKKIALAGAVIGLVFGAMGGWALGRTVPRYGDKVYDPKTFATVYRYKDDAAEVWGLQLEAMGKGAYWTRYAFTFWLKDKPFVSTGQGQYDMMKGLELACTSVTRELRKP